MLKYVYLLVGAVILVLHLAETSQAHWVPFTEIEQHVWWSMAQGWLLTYCLASRGLPERFCCYEVPLYCCIWNTPISGNFVPCITMHLPLFWVLVPHVSLLAHNLMAVPMLRSTWTLQSQMLVLDCRVFQKGLSTVYMTLSYLIWFH